MFHPLDYLLYELTFLSEDGRTSVRVGSRALWSERRWAEILSNSATLTLSFLFDKSETQAQVEPLWGCLTVASEWTGKRTQLILRKGGSYSFRILANYLLCIAGVQPRWIQGNSKRGRSQHLEENCLIKDMERD